jgi:hypothetical protein
MLGRRSHAPEAQPWRISAEVETVICDLRGSHRWWAAPPSLRGRQARSTLYRVLVRHGLIEPAPLRRRWDEYCRRAFCGDGAVATGRHCQLVPADGRECKVITGIDDHSRFCVIATLVLRAAAAWCARCS